MATNPACAYCGRIARLTNEHLWPTCIIERVRSYEMHYSGRADKVIAGDLTIGDVCATCNNGPLSELDAYIGQLYDSHFVHFAEPEKPVDFSCDYDRLLRWLLKISYNAARTVGSDVDVLCKYVPYILGQAPTPQDVGLRLQLVAPAYLVRPEGDAKILVPKTFLPRATRCGRFQLPGRDYDWIVIRSVTLNSYYLYVMITPDPDRDVPMEQLDDVDRNVPGALVEPGLLGMRLVPSGPDALQLMLPHMQAKQGAYDRFVKGGRSK